MATPNRSSYQSSVSKRQSVDLSSPQSIAQSHGQSMPMSSMPHSLPQSQVPPSGSSQSIEQAPLQPALLSQPYTYAPYGSYPTRLSTASATATPAHSTVSSTATPPTASSTGLVSPTQGPTMHTMSSAPSASPSHYAYAPYVPPPSHDPIYSQPTWAGSVDGQQQHQALYAAPHQNALVQGRVPNVYSFVPIQGPQQHKRPRRRYEEIERIYKCGYNGCEKAYGTLNHLNAHVTMQTHGPKRTSDEFKEIRAAWKQRNKENEARKREELAQQQAQSVASAASMPPTPLYFTHSQHVGYQHSPVGYSVVSPLSSNSGAFPMSPYGPQQVPPPGQQPPPRAQPQYQTRQDM